MRFPWRVYHICERSFNCFCYCDPGLLLWQRPPQVTAEYALDTADSRCILKPEGGISVDRAKPAPELVEAVQMRRFACRLAGLVSESTAQVAVEYALVVSVFAALLMGISAMVVTGLANHYREITSVVCLPIP